MRAGIFWLGSGLTYNLKCDSVGDDQEALVLPRKLTPACSESSLQHL